MLKKIEFKTDECWANHVDSRMVVIEANPAPRSKNTGPPYYLHTGHGTSDVLDVRYESGRNVFLVMAKNRAVGYVAMSVFDLNDTENVKPVRRGGRLGDIVTAFTEAPESVFYQNEWEITEVATSKGLDLAPNELFKRLMRRVLQ